MKLFARARELEQENIKLKEEIKKLNTQLEAFVNWNEEDKEEIKECKELLRQALCWLDIDNTPTGTSHKLENKIRKYLNDSSK